MPLDLQPVLDLKPASGGLDLRPATGGVDARTDPFFQTTPSDPYAGAAEEMVRPIVLPEGQAPPDEPGRQISSQPKNITEWTKFMVGGALHPIRQTETAFEQTAIALGLAKPGSRLLWSPSKALETPIATLPAVPPQEGVAGQLAGGVANAALGLAQFFLTPEGALSLGLGLVPREARKVILGFWATKLATDVPEQFKEAYKHAQNGDLQGAVQHATSGTGGVLFSALMAKHATFEAPKPSWLDAESFKEPQERSIPVESVRESIIPKTDQAVESVTKPPQVAREQSAAETAEADAAFESGEWFSAEPSRLPPPKDLVLRRTSAGVEIYIKEPRLVESVTEAKGAEKSPAPDAVVDPSVVPSGLNEFGKEYQQALTLPEALRTVRQNYVVNYVQRFKDISSDLLQAQEAGDQGSVDALTTMLSGVATSLRKMKDDQFHYGSIGGRRSVIVEALRNGEPVNASAADFWGMKIPDGYARSTVNWIDVYAKTVSESKGPVLQPPAPTPTAVVSESGTVPVSAGNIPPARATLPLEEAQGRPTQGVSTVNAGTQASGKLLIDPYSTPMLERLASIGGPVSKQVAREARQIDADALGLIGQISQTLDTARQLAGKAFRGGTTWIRGKENVTPNAAIARLHTLEGTDRAAVVASAPAKAQEMVGAIWDANVPAIGGMAQRANVGFAPTGKIQRILTSPGMDIVLSGGGKLWNRLVEGTATANGKTVADTAAFFKEWKAILDDPSPDMAKIDKIAQDYVRQFPKAITHVKSGPSWIEVLVSDPVDYLKSASERTARAVAFRQVYPNTPAGRQLLVATHKAVLAELPTSIRREEFNNLMKSLQGHRLDSGPEKFAGALPGAQVVAETAGAVARPLRGAMLSLSWLANAAETVIGGPAIFLRFRNVVPLLLKNPVRLYKQMEMAGTVDKSFRNFAFNPTAPARSVSRMISEGIGRLTMNNFFNEVQEFQSSGSARVVADRVRANDLSAGEIKDFESVLRAMGFRENYGQIARGTDLAGLDQFEKQSAPFFSAGHQRPATSSRLANSRAFNSLMWFHRYPQMVLNQFRGIANNLIEDVRTGNKSHMYRDSKLMARFIGGKALQGVLMQLFVTGAKEGVQGIDQKQREAREALASFLLQTTANAIGGPATIAVRLGERVETGEDLASEAIKISAPASTGVDLYNALAGKGRYAGLDTFGVASQFLQSKTPAIPAIRSAMGVVGLAQDNPKLRTAIGGYYRWARKQGYSWPDGQPKDAEFTATMRKVTREMERGGDWQEQLLKAIDVKVEKGEDPAKSIKASLGARKILKNQHGAALNAEETDSLRRWLGEDNFQLLQERDAMVDAVADSF